MHEAVVFAGPSLPFPCTPELQLLLAGCRLLPPAQRGDVLAVLVERPRTIVLIDGYFYGVPAVTHKELLYALDAGTRVLGAASMGALRAAELAAYGMEGVGTVFSWYAAGRVDGDDEVAVLHLPAEHGFRATTVALVEVRHCIDSLAPRLALPPAAVQRFLAAVKARSFAERTLELISAAARDYLPPEAEPELAAALTRQGLKPEDALLALRAASVQTPPPRRQPDRPTVFLNAFRERYLRSTPPGLAGAEAPTFAEAWHMAQVLHPAAGGFVDLLLRRFLLASAALHEGLAPSPRGVERLAERLDHVLSRRLNGCSLPLPEILAEARERLCAELACERLGGPEQALSALEQRLGLDSRGEDGHRAWVVPRSTVWPLWNQARAFAFSPAFPAALAAAVAARQVLRCFQRWTGGLRILDEDLVRLAAGLWRCTPSEVEREAEQRGLAFNEGLYPGFRDALHLVAPAERLPRPVNDYPERKAELIAAPLGAPLVLDRTFSPQQSSLLDSTTTQWEEMS